MKTKTKNILRKSYKVRAYPNKGTAKRAFKAMLKMAAIWNIALVERVSTYEASKKDENIKPINTFKKQYHNIRKKQHPELNKYNAQMMQGVLINLDGSYKSFFDLTKKFPDARPPGIKHIHKCLTFQQSGWHLDGNKLIIPTLGKFKLRMHRPIEGKIKTVSITLDKNLWFVTFSCEMGAMPPKKKKGPAINITLEDECFLSDSEGNYLPNLDYYKSHESEIQRLSKIKDRKQKGSKNRKKAVRTLAKCHRHIKNKRNYDLWDVANYYAERFRQITIYTKPLRLIMQYSVSADEAKKTADNAAGRFIQMLEHKCNERGTILIIVKDEVSWKKEIEKRKEVAKLRELSKILRQAKKAVKYNYRERFRYLETDCEKLTTLRI